MKKFNIEIFDVYKYELEIEANSKQEALKKAKSYYESEESRDGYLGVADGFSHYETKFKTGHTNEQN